MSYRKARQLPFAVEEDDDDDEVNQEVPTQPFNMLRVTAASTTSLAASQSTQNTSSCSSLLMQPSDFTTDHNWQANYKSVKERNAVMFNNELMADVHFKVGLHPNVQRIPAHRFILATGSSVFYAQFFGGLEDTSKDIEIPDIEPAAFLNLLKYLYCDKIDLEADTVLATLYAAKKYILPHLARECVLFLETNLSARNACVLLSQSRLFDEQDLMQRCWEVIDAQAEEALRSDSFTDIDYNTLETILARETINVKEGSIFDAAVRWAEAECVRKDIQATSESKRITLGDSLYKIRIPTMNVEEFANGPAQSGILTLEETNNLFLYYTARTKPQLKFSCVPRRGLLPLRCHRFHSSAYRSNQWRYRGRCDSIQFSANRRIFIAGFGLYGSSNGAAEYKVKIELKKSGLILGKSQTKFFSDGTCSTFAVYFDNPIQIEADTFYTASAILDGSELSFFGQEGMAEVPVGKISFQFQCSSDSTNGTGVQGGQIPELIFYA